MSAFIAALTASSPSASRPAATICSPIPGSAPQKCMSLPRALIDTGTPSASPSRTAAGPSGQKNSASITSNGKRAANSLSSGSKASAIRCAAPAAPIFGQTRKRGR